MDKVWKLFFIAILFSVSFLLITQSDEEINEEEIDQEQLAELNKKFLEIEEKFEKVISKIIENRNSFKEVKSDANSVKI